MKENYNFQEGDALLIVDVQDDFCPGGKLPVQGGDRIVPIINEWIKNASSNRIPIYASRDWHPKEHVSFQSEGGDWPIHCVQDSNGARFHSMLNLPPHAVVVTKGVRFDQDQNSAFDQTGLHVQMQRKGIQRIFVCGLALDVCVRATALDARKHGFRVVLLSNATQPVDRSAEEKTLKELEKAGVEIQRRTPQERIAQDADFNGDVCTKAPEWAEHQRFDDLDQPCDDGRSGKI